MALYNEMRPQFFYEVLGQDSVTTILKNSVKKGKISNSYLFTGTRGTGKTTTARILARAINCEHRTSDGEPCGVCDSCLAVKEGTSLNVFEMDAAQNSGVDDARRLIANTKLASVTGHYKVFIIDEVHMMSTAAFNALLKTLEEPPKDCVFILCTTESTQIPLTIKSRCQRYDFSSMGEDIIVSQLKKVIKEKGRDYEEDALYLIADAAKGAMRDALSILEQCMVEEEVLSASYIRELMGYTDEEQLADLFYCLAGKDPASAFQSLSEIEQTGQDAKTLIESALSMLFDIMQAQALDEVTGIRGTECYRGKVEALSQAFSVHETYAFIRVFTEAKREIEKSTNPYQVLHSYLICEITKEDKIKRLEREVEQLKKEWKDSVTNLEAVADPMKKQEEKEEKEELSNSSDTDASGEEGDGTFLLAEYNVFEEDEEHGGSQGEDATKREPDRGAVSEEELGEDDPDFWDTW